MTTEKVNDDSRPTRGSRWATIEKEIVSGISASAVTSPATSSTRR
jgi:hypothetical protein